MKTINEALEGNRFNYQMRIIKNNAETVTLTLSSYEDLKLQIKQQDEKYNILLKETIDVIKNNGNFKLENKYSKFAFGNWYFSIKTGVNQEIDELRAENKKLKEESNKKLSLAEKLKILFS
jgi:DNA mismatch repair ATPase MutS